MVTWPFSNIVRGQYESTNALQAVRPMEAQPSVASWYRKVGCWVLEIGWFLCNMHRHCLNQMVGGDVEISCIRMLHHFAETPLRWEDSFWNKCSNVDCTKNARQMKRWMQVNGQRLPTRGGLVLDMEAIYRDDSEEWFLDWFWDIWWFCDGSLIVRLAKLKGQKTHLNKWPMISLFFALWRFCQGARRAEGNYCMQPRAVWGHLGANLFWSQGWHSTHWSYRWCVKDIGPGMGPNDLGPCPIVYRNWVSW